MEAKEKGAKIVTMDPRLSNTASKSDVWMPTWPGSETVVLLAIANYLLENDLYDREYLRKWLNWEDSLAHFRDVQPEDSPLDLTRADSFEDFERLLKTLYAEITIDRAARESGVVSRLIRGAAE